MASKLEQRKALGAPQIGRMVVRVSAPQRTVVRLGPKAVRLIEAEGVVEKKVRGRVGRRPKHGVAMTGAERQRAWRKRKKEAKRKG